MRILLIGGGVHPIPPTGYGAVEQILTDLRAALLAAGQEAVIINRVRHRRTRDEYPFAWELPRILRNERYDVLHAHTPVVANRLAGRRLPFAYTSHSRHWYYRDRWTHQWGYFLERRAVRRATAVIALTEPLRRTMEAVVRPPHAPLTVVPFGVDADRFRPAWDRRTGGRALGVGVVLPFKRWEWAAEALKGSGLTLSIAGPMPSREYAEEVRRAGDRVELLGEVDPPTLERLYAESDLLVHPSAVEILSATVLQGLAAGLPAIGGPAVDGVVDPDVTGWVLPDRSREEFVRSAAEKARRLSSDPAMRRRMGDAARAVAQDRFSWRKVVEAHLEVYRSVVGRSSPSHDG